MWKSFVQLFFPKTCVSCVDLLPPNEEFLCVTCRHQLPLTIHFDQPNNEVFRIFEGHLPITHAAAMFYFDKKTGVQNLVHLLKYKNHQRIGTFLGEWLGKLLVQHQWKPDLIVPVPLHPKKQRQRGYNQLTKFGKAIAKELQIPFNEDVLIRTKYQISQTKLNKMEREAIRENTFVLNPKYQLHNQTILLIDDIITTGSTLKQCGKALHVNNQIKIQIASIGYTLL
jgi:ComF family protein